MATRDPLLCLLFSILTISQWFLTIEASQSDQPRDRFDELWLVGEDDPVSALQTRRHERRKGCDYSVGKWVYDPSYPLYDADCPYLSSAVSCQRNGRPDSDYQKWRWKPKACSIPRFDALKFMGKMRRKRIMLVGDSIMRNQWESLVCLIQAVIPTGRKRVTYNGPTMSFHALDFETSIEFCWAPLLVELKRDGDRKRVLHLDAIEDNGRYWRGVDVLVFDSAHWWTHSHNWTSWDYYMEGNKMFKAMNPMVAYEKGMTTWAKWVEVNLDPLKTKVVFRSMSPTHNRESGRRCYNQKQPLPYNTKPHVPEQLMVLKEVLKNMRFRVYLHDVTAMSAYRRDGHPSVYKRAIRHEEKRSITKAPSDCSHWCLPGVPDIWNEMLSSILLTNVM